MVAVTNPPADKLPASMSVTPSTLKQPAQGYCYLLLIAEHLHNEASEALGALPTVGDVRRWVNSRRNPFEGHGIQVSILPSPTTVKVGELGVVGHITSGGCRPAEALSALHKDLRLGANVGQTEAESGAHGRATAGPLASGGGLRRSIPFFVGLNNDNTSATINFSNMPGTINLFGAFESVTLEGVQVTATVHGDSSSFANVAFTTSPVSPADVHSWMCAEVSTIVGGADGEITRGESILPDDHSFGREIKGLAVGNAPPFLHLGFVTGNPGRCYIRGLIHVTMRGVGNLAPISIPPTTAASAPAAKAPRNSVNRGDRAA